MHPITKKLAFPLKKYQVSGYVFLENVKSKNICQGIHLGEDVRAAPGTEVKCVGNGKVVYAAQHPGTSQKGNWGNIVIIGHRKSGNKEEFYSLYGHLHAPFVKRGDTVKIGRKIGIIAKSNTPENGWWPAHLHFAIYLGPWTGTVLPGYFQNNSKRTKLEYWVNPSEFIRKYNKTK